MPRLLNVLGFLVFILGAVALAVAAYILLAGVIGWNPFSYGRPMIAGVNTMLVCSVVAFFLLGLGAVLAQAAARAQWQRELQATVAP